MLNKKSNSNAYHFVQEHATEGVVVVSYEPIETNVTDMLTKIQPGPTRKKLAEMVLS